MLRGGPGRRISVVVLVVLGATAALPASAPSSAQPSSAAASASKKQFRVVLLGLRERGKLGQFVGRVSNPASSSYRQFLTLGQFRQRFSARAGDRKRVLGYLRSRAGVRKA